MPILHRISKLKIFSSKFAFHLIRTKYIYVYHNILSLLSQITLPLFVTALYSTSIWSLAYKLGVRSFKVSNGCKLNLLLPCYHSNAIKLSIDLQNTKTFW